VVLKVPGDFYGRSKSEKKWRFFICLTSLVIPDNGRPITKTTGLNLERLRQGKITHFVSSWVPQVPYGNVLPILKRKKNKNISIVGVQPYRRFLVFWDSKMAKEYLLKYFDASKVDQVLGKLAKKNLPKWL